MATPTKEIIRLIRNNVFNTVARKVRGDLTILYDGEKFDIKIIKSNYAFITSFKIPITDFIAGYQTSEEVGLAIVAFYKKFILEVFLK